MIEAAFLLLDVRKGRRVSAKENAKENKRS
jgi:hypothetical protein